MPVVFPEWHDRTVEDVLYLCRELLEDTTFPTVQRWRDAGGKVVGHFQVYFPEEIAHAAGALPFKVRGAPVEPMLADSHFGVVPLLYPQDLPRIGAQRQARDGVVRHPPDLRCRSQSGWGFRAERLLPLPDPVSAPERQFGACPRVSAW